MTVMRTSLCLLLAIFLSGCSTWFRDRASDYRTAAEEPPLTLPEGQETRSIKPLYPIPAGEVAKLDTSKKFQVPKPRPLVPTEAASSPEARPAPAVPQRPVLTQDGNGYPVVSIAGDFNAVWDRLGEALKAADVKVDDRDQRVGMYYLSLPESGGKAVIYQLRVARGQSACILTLQKDDDTLAPQATTKTLFESIVNRWPPEPGETDGKARPALYR